MGKHIGLKHYVLTQDVLSIICSDHKNLYE